MLLLTALFGNAVALYALMKGQQRAKAQRGEAQRSSVVLSVMQQRTDDLLERQLPLEYALFQHIRVSERLKYIFNLIELGDAETDELESVIADFVSSQLLLENSWIELLQVEELNRLQDQGTQIQSRVEQILQTEVQPNPALFAAALKDVDQLILHVLELELKLEELSDAASRSIRQASDAAGRATQEAIASATQSMDELKLESNLVIGGSLVVLIIGVGAVVYLIARVARPVSNMLPELNQLLQGDLSQSVTLRGKGEVRELAMTVNDFARKLQHDFSAVRSQVKVLADHMAQERVNMSIMRDTLRHQSSLTTDIAINIDAALDATERTEEVTQQAFEANQQASTEVQSSQQVVKLAIHAISSLAEKIEAATQQIQELAEEAQGIRNIANMIATIADQTNMLALNAAIEAARAGEQGRGFAVVADEVRGLAARTQEATTEIGRIVDVLRDHTTSVTKVMAQGNSMASSNAEQAKIAGESLKTVTFAIQNSASLSDVILESSSSQRASIAGVKKRLNEINEAAHTSVERYAKVVKSSQQLTKLVEDIDHMMDRYNLRDTDEAE